VIKKIVITAIMAISVSACQTANPYPDGPGFYETQVESNRYRITYVAPNGMPRQRAEDFLLLRAADTALQNGYDWFEVVGRAADIDQRSGGPRVSVGTGTSSFGGNTAIGLGLGTSFDLGGGPRSVLNMEIVLGSGAAPSAANIYDAQDVSQTIRARL
jgi:hypothetical protein